MASLSRRQLLRAMAALAGGGAALATGCGGFGAPADEEGTVRIPLSRLPAGERIQVDVAGSAVELRRTGDAVSARSLTCTHWGCRVHWDEAERLYKCPCHHGQFDENGEVVSGPPPRPLAAVPVVIADGAVVLRPSSLHPSPSRTTA